VKLHPRHDQVTKAGLQITQAVTFAVKQHELTYGELMGILAEVISTWAKFQVRDEREEK
jgi:hypothetical protein